MQSSRTTDSHELKDLDLDLDSEWFAKGTWPPPSVSRLPWNFNHAKQEGWSSSGARKTHFLNGAFRDNNTLATTNINLTWDASWPKGTVKAQQRHTPPPRKLRADELDHYRKR